MQAEGEAAASREEAMGERTERRAGITGKRKYGAVVEEGHLSDPVQPFCCPCDCFCLSDEGSLSHVRRSSP